MCCLRPIMLVSHWPASARQLLDAFMCACMLTRSGLTLLSSKVKQQHAGAGAVTHYQMSAVSRPVHPICWEGERQARQQAASADVQHVNVMFISLQVASGCAEERSVWGPGQDCVDTKKTLVLLRYASCILSWVSISAGTSMGSSALVTWKMERRRRGRNSSVCKRAT